MNSHVMLYSHDALGLGHVRRMLSIASSVLAGRSDLSTLLITCSPQIDALPIPAGLDYVKLPSTRKLSAHQYVARSLRCDSARLAEMRSSMITDAARIFEPDLLLTDKSPLGLMGELQPSLELLHRRRGGARPPRLVLGWRDILDGPAHVREEWKAKRTIETIERWYDEIWVYGDPEIYDIRTEYDLPDRLIERVRYLGYLSPRVDHSARARARAQLGEGSVALVTPGGGEDGEALVAGWVDAVRLGLLPRELRTLIVTGPFFPAESLRRLRGGLPDSVTITPFVSGLESFVAAADLLVGMAGYNTVCEMLAGGTPAVLCPRAGQRDEQRLRALSLARRGRVECVEAEQLTGRRLAEAALRALAAGRHPARPASHEAPGLSGLDQVARQFDRLLPPMAEPLRTGFGPELLA